MRDSTQASPKAHTLTPETLAKNIMDVQISLGLAGAFLGSIGYLVTFQSYHKSLVKLEALHKLFKDPNARVASGK